MLADDVRLSRLEGEYGCSVNFDRDSGGLGLGVIHIGLESGRVLVVAHLFACTDAVFQLANDASVDKSGEDEASPRVEDALLGRAIRLVLVVRGGLGVGRNTASEDRGMGSLALHDIDVSSG